MDNDFGRLPRISPGAFAAGSELVAATEAKRDRVFCAKALLDILEEPARLTPVEPARLALGPNMPPA